MKTIKRRYVPLLVAACFGVADAAPTLPQVVAGQATFSQQGNVFSITNTPGTIINWQSFSINPGEITRFIQQSADSAVLNRILGQDPTRILGALQSNGKVFLINPNGILFGKDSRVDVGGLVASTLNISNADFLAGKKDFTATPGAGDVRNEGAIATPGGGQVFLIAPNVTNSGVITSPQGDVVLAAGHSVQLVDSRDPNMQVVVSAPASQAINLGQVVAQGGRIGIYGALVNQRGLVSANSAVVGENGKIVLKASRDTMLEKGSVTTATGAGTGGEINLLGERVGLVGDARVDASGAQGGGTVLAGGDWQGRNAALPNARQTWLGKDAVIKADATTAGDGGKVVLWADDATSAFGSISARGGALGGNGGKVETSAHDLDVNGLRVDAGAASGKAGTWLLDPFDIEVVGTGTASPGDVSAFDKGPSTGVAKVSPTVLDGASGTDIVLQAQNDITFTDSLSTAKNVRAEAGRNINVNANVTSSAGNLDFRAANAFTLANGATLRSGGYIDLKADNMYLDGNIDGVSGTLPVISFTSFSRDRYIKVGAGAPSAGSPYLWLDNGALTRFNAFGITLGDSLHSAGLTIEAPVVMSANLVLENAGSISFNAPVDLRSGAQSQVVATLYGPNDTGVSVGEGASVSASKAITLRTDNVRFYGTLRANSVSLMPHNADTPIAFGDGEGHFVIFKSVLDRIEANELTIGGLPGHFAPMTVAGDLDLSDLASLPTRITLDAGNSPLLVEGSLKLADASTLLLKSDTGIFQSETGAIIAANLALKGGDVSLAGYNRIGTLAAASDATNIYINAVDGFSVGHVAGAGMAGITAHNAFVALVSQGQVSVDHMIESSSASIDASGIRGGATIKTGALWLGSRDGIGEAGAALKTDARAMSLLNMASGDKMINVENQGDLVLHTAVQHAPEEGAANAGAIAVSTTGAMLVAPEHSETPTVSESGLSVATGSGDITLTAGNGLTVDGGIHSESGHIRLVAANGTKFTTNETAHVKAVSGDITVVAGATSIAPETLLASSPSKIHLPGTPAGGGGPIPTVDACLANPTQAGCGDVITKAKEACILNPDAPNCGSILPPVTECKTNPDALGCKVVLERDAITQCAATPGDPRCQDVLPKYDACEKDPTAFGCAAVVKHRQEIDACLATPKAGNCQSVLPDYDLCAANPGMYGCGPAIKEREEIKACMANVKAPGCADVLPKLDACHGNANVFGCEAVLEREKFDICLINPNGPNCDAVLPKLDSCKVNPAAEGCDKVIAKKFDACLGNPGDAACEGILPKVSECVGDKTKPGCQVVLPKMDECIGSPTLQGCSVVLPRMDQCVGNPNQQGCVAVLPKLEQCAVNPNQPGCEAVLPKPDFCATHPTDPRCVAFNPGAGGGTSSEEKQPVAKAVQTTVSLIDRSAAKPGSTGTANSSPVAGTTPAAGGTAAKGEDDSSAEKQSEKQNGPAPAENSGANDAKPATKMYCN